MFDEKMMKNLVLTNLILGVAVLLIAVANLIGTFGNVSIIDTNAKPVAQKAQPAKLAGNNNDKISQKYGKKTIDLEKALAKGKPVAVLFYADWCGFCKRFAPTFAELAKDKDLKKTYTFVYVNSEDSNNRKYMQQYKITGFPTLYLINPKTVDKAHVSNGLMFGADPVSTMKEQFEKFLTEGSSAVTQPAPRPQAEDAE